MPVEPENPYSTPEADISKQAPAKPGSIWRKEGLLAIPIGTELPDICLMTGRRGTGKYFDKKLTWAPPWVFIFILLNLLILLIVYLIARKQGRLKYYLDDEIVTKMQKQKRFSLIAFPSLIVAMTIGGAYNIAALLVLPLLVLLVLIIVMIVIYPKLRISKIDKNYIYLAKVNPEAMMFLLENQD